MNTRWVVPTLTLAAAVMLAPACDDDGDGTGGSGGSGGAGGTGAAGGGGSSGACQPGQKRFNYLPGEAYVALLADCPDPASQPDLRMCEACACAKDEASCIVHGRVYDTSMCLVDQSTPFAVKASEPQYCIATGGINPNISVDAYASCEVLDPKLDACPIPADAGLDRIDGACIPDELTPVLGRLCILVEGHIDCAAQYPDYPSSTPVYENGSCGCDCIPTGPCSDLTVHEALDCSEPAFAIDGSANCYVGPVEARAVKVGDVPTCMPTEPNPTGTEKTLCCLGSP